jgi:hypothetical protein
MPRTKGTFNFSANFEGNLRAPIDAKQLVSMYSDLVDPSTWFNEGNDWTYVGMIVSVSSDPSTEYNGIYVLNDSDYTTYDSWTRIGVYKDTSIEDLYKWNESQDASIDNIDASISYLDLLTQLHDISIGQNIIDILDISSRVYTNEIDISNLEVSVGDLDTLTQIHDASIGQNIIDISNLESSVGLLDILTQIHDASIGSITLDIANVSDNLYDLQVYVDGSLLYIQSAYIPDASLGSEFYWDEGVLHLDASAVTDASIDELYTILGTEYDSSIFISEDYTSLENISELDKILGLLAPAKPGELSTKSLSNPGTYSARLESDGTLTSNITTDTTPTSVASNFYKIEDVSITAYINEVSSGSIYVTSADMTGYSDESLTISNDSDPYDGQSGKEGFWRQLSATITTAVALDASTESYTYGLKYPNSTNEATPAEFYVDNPKSPSISSQQIDVYPLSITRYISGVPSYAVGDEVELSYTVVDPVSKFYHKDYIGYSYLNAGDAVYAGLPGAPYSEGDNVNVSAQVHTFADNQYEESGSIKISIDPYNSRIRYTSGKGDASVLGRIDTVSDESDRVLSGSGLYPSSFGGIYDSSIDLTTGDYVNELQLLNGYYAWPDGDYTGWESGPDYSSLSSGTRWVTFQADVSLSNHTSFTLNIWGDNFSANSSQITQDVSILARVVGSSPTAGWVNCNYPYDGVSNPTNDGDAAMVVTQSDEDTKRVTFGTSAKTGALYIRIGISDTGTPHFRSITVTDRI